MDYYATCREHILAELERIDLLIRMQVSRAREVARNPDEFQGLYITEQEVDELVNRPIGLPQWARDEMPLGAGEVRRAMDAMSAEIALRGEESKRRGISLRLDELMSRFQLSRFDLDAVLICLAPELDLRYEHIYAYL